MKPQKYSTEVALVAVHLVKLPELLNSPDVASLPEADRRRAETFTQSEDRNAFLAGRVLLRKLLLTEFGSAYASVPILQEPNHKPRLASGGVEFSVSHVRHLSDWCAVALSHGCPVGIDAEPIERFPAMGGVVSEFFPLIAAAGFQAASPGERTRLFFRWWTRIEAALKAAGRGLDHSRSCFEGVRVESSNRVPGLALAVAAKSSRPLRVIWHVPLECGSLLPL
jgi:4'-phosphopantetheinyl transferase